MAARNAEKQIPPEPHWGFCYTMLHKVSRSFGLIIQQLGPELRNAVCIFYLVLRALVTLDLLIESVCPNGSKPKEYNYLGLSSDCSSVDSSVPIPSFSNETKTNLYLKATELTKNTEEVDGKVEE